MLFVARPPRRSELIDVSIVIPAYNERARLPHALGALQDHVDPATTEILVVDDGSDDGTGDVAIQAGAWAPHLVVLRHDANQGKGAAVRTGVAAAAAPVIAFIDADNATDVSALAPMIESLTDNVGAVFGSRHAPGSTVTGAPALRGVMGRIFNHVVQAAAGTSIRDTQCGAKVFRSSAARLAFADTTVDGFAFDVEVLRRLLAMGLDVVEYPVTWKYVDGTKIQLTTPFRMLRDIAKIRLAKPRGGPAYIDTEYDEELAPFIDAVRTQTMPAPGIPIRIVFPFGRAADVESTLEHLGLERRQSQGATWPELLRPY